MTSLALPRLMRFPLARLALRVPQTLLAWSDRHRQRHDLRNLDAHMLKDIGVDWATAHVEAHKPFWRR